ncbi:hypothetical protein Tco_0374871 [Tanacetum coccineum]
MQLRCLECPRAHSPGLSPFRYLHLISGRHFLYHQMDVKCVFSLLAQLKNEERLVICHQPPGFVESAHPNKVYKDRMVLEDLVHRQNLVFLKKNRVDIMLSSLVDDIIFGSTKKSMCTEFEERYAQRCKMSFHGRELHSFLSVYFITLREDTAIP